jgi:hypothetical protein
MMRHLEILVEEPSAEAFLSAWLTRLLDDRATFKIHAFQGKSDLLANLEKRLKAYARWLPDHARILILIDRDSADCVALEARLEQASEAAGLPTRTVVGGPAWKVANRIAIEELEAWYFGAWESVRRAYPRAPANVPRKAVWRQSDKITGGTWEAFERVMRKVGYFEGGLRKVEAAQAIGAEFNADECHSPSFTVFHAAVLEAVA